MYLRRTTHLLSLRSCGPDQKNYGFNCPPLFAEVSMQGPRPTGVHNNVVLGYSIDTESMSDLGDDTSATLETWIDAINYNHIDPDDPRTSR